MPWVLSYLDLIMITYIDPHGIGYLLLLVEIGKQGGQDWVCGQAVGDPHKLLLGQQPPAVGQLLSPIDQSRTGGSREGKTS